MFTSNGNGDGKTNRKPRVTRSFLSRAGDFLYPAHPQCETRCADIFMREPRTFVFGRDNDSRSRRDRSCRRRHYPYTVSTPAQRFFNGRADTRTARDGHDWHRPARPSLTGRVLVARCGAERRGPSLAPGRRPVASTGPAGSRCRRPMATVHGRRQPYDGHRAPAAAHHQQDVRSSCPGHRGRRRVRGVASR